jgi:hypothetical protein
MCPGSVLATAGMPDTESEYSAEGTFAHEVSEIAREEGKPARKYIGMIKEIGPYKFKVDKPFAEAVQTFLDYVAQFPGDAYFEERVTYYEWVPEPKGKPEHGGFGTADDIRIEEGVCYVTDLKFGKGVAVHAKDNIQLKLYALGVHECFDAIYDIEKYVLNICQPRIGIIEEFVISREDLIEWADAEVRPTAKRSLKPGAPFAAGDWCQFCKIKQRCKTRAEKAEKALLDEMGDVIDPKLLNNTELGEKMDMVKFIRKWCTDIAELTLSEVQKGHEVTGEAGNYKLVAGRGSRQWKNVKRAEAALRKAKLKVGDIFERKMISPAAAEKIIGAKHDIMTKQVNKLLGKPTLAPGDDTRSEFAVSMDEMSVVKKK